MGKGRKKLPTKVKEMQGTLDVSRQNINEMQVDICNELPIAPEWLSDIGKDEWYKITNQLFNLQMLYNIDLQLVAAYCNEMSLYIETEILLRDKGRVQIFKNADGTIKHTQAVPYQKIAKDALDKALKIAVHFGLTPVARASISAPKITNNTQINYFD